MSLVLSYNFWQIFINVDDKCVSESDAYPGNEIGLSMSDGSNIVRINTECPGKFKLESVFFFFFFFFKVQV